VAMIASVKTKKKRADAHAMKHVQMMNR